MIAVDVGNTILHFTWIAQGKIIKTRQLATGKANREAIKRIIGKDINQPILACSVVPHITRVFKNIKRKIYIIGKDIKIPLKCFYDKRHVGIDRLVGAYAAKTLYPESRIIIDFGTAITFDFLSKRGDYQGGFILPGIGSTLRVLSSCALLPDKIILRKSKTLIPKDTRESINRGIAEGFSVMLNALVKKYKRILKLSAKDKVVITGGDAKFILPKIEFSYQYEPFLVIKGMVILAKKFSPQ